jgi:hypothetical protein
MKSSPESAVKFAVFERAQTMLAPEHEALRPGAVHCFRVDEWLPSCEVLCIVFELMMWLPSCEAWVVYCFVTFSLVFSEQTFACGAAGGVAAHASCFPLEVLKTKMAGSPAGT